MRQPSLSGPRELGPCPRVPEVRGLRKPGEGAVRIIVIEIIVREVARPDGASSLSAFPEEAKPGALGVLHAEAPEVCAPELGGCVSGAKLQGLREYGAGVSFSCALDIARHDFPRLRNKEDRDAGADASAAALGGPPVLLLEGALRRGGAG